MVGLPRFELGTSCPPDKRATRLRHSPTKKERMRKMGSRFSELKRFFLIWGIILPHQPNLGFWLASQLYDRHTPFSTFKRMPRWRNW